MNDKILFIMEGKKDDPKLLKSLLDTYKTVLDYDGYSSNVIVSYTSNIYSLYNELKKLDNDKDEFADLFPIVQKKDSKLNSYSRDEFSAIYLFFDLDIHKRDEKKAGIQLGEMVKTFNNETENGKLFISYPMVEVAKICDKYEGLFKEDRKLFSLESCKRFKEFANNHTRSTRKTDSLEDWNLICKENYRKANWILTGCCSIPDIPYLKKMEQEDILDKELEFVESKNSVATLSAYPMWLKDQLESETIEKLFYTGFLNMSKNFMKRVWHDLLNLWSKLFL